MAASAVTGNGEPSDLPAGAILPNSSTQYVESWKFVETGSGNRDTSDNYTSIVASVETNPAVTAGTFLQKVGSAVGFANTKTVTVSVQQEKDTSNPNPAKIILLALTQTANGNILSPQDGDQVIVSPRTYSGTDTLGLDFATSYGNSVQSALISNALTAAADISKILAAAPAAAIISAIPQTDAQAGDKLLDALASNSNDFNPALHLSVSDLEYDSQWDFVIFDKCAPPIIESDSSRTWIADIRIKLGLQKSLFLGQTDTNGNFRPGTLPISIEDTHLGSGSLSGIITQSYPQAAEWYSQDYPSYYKFCSGLKSFLGGSSLGLNPRDVYAAEWALLSEASGGSSFTTSDEECPSQSDLNEMTSIGLDTSKLPLIAAVAARNSEVAQLNRQLDALATDWVNDGTNKDPNQSLDSLMLPFIKFDQTVPALSGIAVGEEPESVDQLETALTTMKKTSSMKLTGFFYSPQNPLVGEAELVVGAQNYYFQATFNSSLKLTEIDISDKSFS